VTERELIERYFRAMRTGSIASDEILDLFAEDAVYVEPFSGAPMEHVGKQDIRRSFVESRKQTPPDMTLTLDELNVERDCIRSVWTCMSPAFPQSMRGQDVWTIRDGMIHRLETSFVEGEAESDGAQR
jgi:ketosteroid isomerase-like protein